MLMITMKVSDSGYYYKEMTEPGFPVDVIHRHLESPGMMTERHWHEHMQVFSFSAGYGGSVVVTCGSERVVARGGDLVIVNPRELHSAECVEGPMDWDVIRVDFAFIASRINDGCQANFIAPLEGGDIVFQNLVRSDPAVADCVSRIVAEFARREPGFELSIKGSLYALLALLFRSHCVRRMDNREREERARNVERLSAILEYIDGNLGSSLRLGDLATRAGVTPFHFCKIFRAGMGMTPVEYVNRERVARAERLLAETALTVTEIAYAVGVGDANYFSRLFRRYRGASPKEARASGVSHASGTSRDFVDKNG